MQNTIKEAKLGSKQFFTEDLAPKVQEATARSSQATLLSLALKGRGQPRQDSWDMDSRPPQRTWNYGVGSHSQAPSQDQGSCRQSEHPGRQPFQEGRPGQGGRGQGNQHGTKSQLKPSNKEHQED